VENLSRRKEGMWRIKLIREEDKSGGRGGKEEGEAER